MPNEVLQFEQDQAVGVITLARPEVHNAVDERMMDALEGLLDDLDQEPQVRVLVLTGAGDESFCAGGDLRYFASLEDRGAGLAMSRRMQALLTRLAEGSRVMVAAINGQALGGGCEILTACHLRVAAMRARFAYRQASNGVITGWGGGIRLFRLVGRARALRLLLTAESISAEEALEMGLVDRVVPDDTLREEALDLARTIAGNSPQAVQSFLRLAHTFEHEGPAAARALETALFGESWVSDRFRETLARYRR